jgi:hypothetical protein
VARLRPPRAPDLPRLRPRLGELPLEQLPLAARRHQLGEHPPAYGWPRHLRRPGIWGGLVRDKRWNADRGGAAAGGVLAISEAIYAVVYAGGDQIRPDGSRNSSAVSDNSVVPRVTCRPSLPS